MNIPTEPMRPSKMRRMRPKSSDATRSSIAKRQTIERSRIRKIKRSQS